MVDAKERFVVGHLGNIQSENLRKTLAFVVGHSSDVVRTDYATLQEDPSIAKKLHPIELGGKHENWSKSTF